MKQFNKIKGKLNIIDLKKNQQKFYVTSELIKIIRA